MALLQRLDAFERAERVLADVEPPERFIPAMGARVLILFSLASRSVSFVSLATGERSVIVFPETFRSSSLVSIVDHSTFFRSAFVTRRSVISAMRMKSSAPGSFSSETASLIAVFTGSGSFGHHALKAARRSGESAGAGMSSHERMPSAVCLSVSERSAMHSEIRHRLLDLLRIANRQPLLDLVVRADRVLRLAGEEVRLTEVVAHVKPRVGVAAEPISFAALLAISGELRIVLVVVEQEIAHVEAAHVGAELDADLVVHDRLVDAFHVLERDSEQVVRGAERVLGLVEAAHGLREERDHRLQQLDHRLVFLLLVRGGSLLVCLLQFLGRPCARGRALAFLQELAEKGVEVFGEFGKPRFVAKNMTGSALALTSTTNM